MPKATRGERQIECPLCLSSNPARLDSMADGRMCDDSAKWHMRNMPVSRAHRGRTIPKGRNDA